MTVSSYCPVFFSVCMIRPNWPSQANSASARCRSTSSSARRSAPTSSGSFRMNEGLSLTSASLGLPPGRTPGRG